MNRIRQNLYIALGLNLALSALLLVLTVENARSGDTQRLAVFAGLGFVAMWLSARLFEDLRLWHQYDASASPLFDATEEDWRSYPDGAYVYVIQDEEFSHYCKIGRTRSPEGRIGRFEVALPFRVRVICVIPCSDDSAMESQLHRRFKHKRVNGEWFALKAGDIDELRSLARKGAREQRWFRDRVTWQ